MLKDDKFLTWCKCLGLAAATCETVAKVGSRGPTRRVGGGRSNVSGRYPSRKMGVTIQFESHKVELAFIYQLEHDSSVLEYYDQPPSIPLAYDASNGRRLSVLHTPDFFVIRTEAAGWEECKTEDDLGKLAEKSPNRYQRDTASRWRSAPGESHANQFGLYYHVRSDASINWTLQQNLQFLDDYLRVDSTSISPKLREDVIAETARHPGLLLSELIQRTKDVASRDVIHFMIAAGEIFTDLSAAAVSRPAEVTVFANAEVAAAFRNTSGAPPDARLGREIKIVPGEAVSWDGTVWRIVNVGDQLISLLGEDGALTELPCDTLERLIAAGRLDSSARVRLGSSDRAQILSGASEADLREANRRVDLVKRHMSGEQLPVPERTLRFWTALYRKGREEHGSGYLGATPKDWPSREPHQQTTPRDRDPHGGVHFEGLRDVQTEVKALVLGIAESEMRRTQPDGADLQDVLYTDAAAPGLRADDEAQRTTRSLLTRAAIPRATSDYDSSRRPAV